MLAKSQSASLSLTYSFLSFPSLTPLHISLPQPRPGLSVLVAYRKTRLRQLIEPIEDLSLESSLTQPPELGPQACDRDGEEFRNTRAAAWVGKGWGVQRWGWRMGQTQSRETGSRRPRLYEPVDCADVEWPLFSTVCGFSLPRVFALADLLQNQGPRDAVPKNKPPDYRDHPRRSFLLGCGHPKEGAHVGDPVCDT